MKDTIYLPLRLFTFQHHYSLPFDTTTHYRSTSLLIAVQHHYYSLPSSDQIDIEIFDLLMSLGDFTEFKELMLAHKRDKKMEASGKSGELLTIFGVKV